MHLQGSKPIRSNQLTKQKKSKEEVELVDLEFGVKKWFLFQVSVVEKIKKLRRILLDRSFILG